MSVSLFVINPKKEFVFVDGDSNVIVKNVFNGAVVTVLKGKKVELFAKSISSDPVDAELLHYIMRKNFFCDGEPSAKKWADSVTEEDIDSARVLFSLDGKK